jgi:hypothetical protein
MIANNHERQNIAEQVDKLRIAIAEAECAEAPPASGAHCLHVVFLDAMRAQLRDLERALREYDDQR